MKNLQILLCGIAFAILTFPAHAQTEQGNFLLGGESKLDFSSVNSKWKSDNSSGDGTTTTTFEFSPQVGYFFADNFAVGVQLPVSSSTEKDEDDDKLTITSMAFAPFVRYYFGTSNIKPYLHGGVGMGSVKVKTEVAGESEDITSDMFLYDLGGGLGIFFTEKVSLDIGLSYASAFVKPKEGNDINYRDITSGISLGVGVVVVL